MKLLHVGIVLCGVCLSTVALAREPEDESDGSEPRAQDENAAEGDAITENLKSRVRKDRDVAIFANPVMLAFGVISAEVDYSPERFVSLNLTGSYYSKDDSIAYYGTIGPQFFLTGRRSFQGLYLYPLVGFGHAKVSVRDYRGFLTEGSSSLWTVGGTLGYQWCWRFGLVLRVGGGLRYINASAEAHSPTSSGGSTSASVGLKGVSPALDLSLGFAF